MRNLILTGGIGHDFADAAPALAGLLRDAAIESTITQDIEGGLRELAAGGFGLVTVYARRWGRLSGEKSAPPRAAGAFSRSGAGRRTLTGFVEGGGGLRALHTAVICFDDWAGWRVLLGGKWRGGRSTH